MQHPRTGRQAAGREPVWPEQDALGLGTDCGRGRAAAAGSSVRYLLRYWETLRNNRSFFLKNISMLLYVWSVFILTAFAGFVKQDLDG